STFTVNKAGKYIVSKTNQCGSLKDSTLIIYSGLPYTNLGHDTEICNGESLLLGNPCKGCSYLWQDKSTEAYYLVKVPGTYQLTVSNQCGKSRDSISVSY